MSYCEESTYFNQKKTCFGFDYKDVNESCHLSFKADYNLRYESDSVHNRMKFICYSTSRYPLYIAVY